MKTKKIPISFSGKDQGEIQETAELYGLGVIDHDYGAIPKTVKNSITFAKALPGLLEKFIPDMEPDKLDLLFSSIKRIKLAKYKRQEIEKIQNDGNKV